MSTTIIALLGIGAAALSAAFYFLGFYTGRGNAMREVSADLRALRAGMRVD